MTRLALIALLLALAVPAAAGAVSRARRTGVLDGVVTRGPACTGQPQPCGEPLPGVNIVFVRRGHTVAHATTTGSGQYRIRLRAGRYGVRLPGRNQWRPAQVRVLRGQVTRINIAIDSLTG